MQWFTKYFSAGDISSGYDKKMEDFLVKVIVGKESPRLFIEDEDSIEYRARFAAYRTDVEANGGFTSYFTEAVVGRFPYLETDYVLTSCDKPDISAIKTWIGIEPLASRILQQG